MPYWERDRLKKQTQKAVRILRKMDSLPYDIEVELGSDEATCSQVSFLYGEAQKFPGNGELFFNLIKSKKRQGKVRIASLDIGGGTTDLMISDYKRMNPQFSENSDLEQELIYSDGINFAGDDILKHLINRCVIERLRDSLDANTTDRFQQTFGAASPESQKQERLDVMKALFIPMAELYMHCMDKNIDGNDFSNKTCNELNEYLKDNGLNQIKNFNDTIIKTNEILGGSDEPFNIFSIVDPVPSINELDAEVMRVFQPTLVRFAWVIREHRPDYLILAGKTTSLPVIPRALMQWVALPPSKIIPLKDFHTGSWHPFSRLGAVHDPKTSVVVGNAISHISKNRKMSDVNIMTAGSGSEFTLNFVGSNVGGKTLNQNQLLYENGRAINNKIHYVGTRINILYRNINDHNMPCNLMYVLDLKNDDRDIQLNGGGLTITVNADNPDVDIHIEDVSGDVMDIGSNQVRPATIDDIQLNEQTLFEGEYFLDNGKFQILNRS